VRTIAFLCGVIVLIVAGCCIAGCSYLPFSKVTPSDSTNDRAPAGFTTGVPPEEPENFSSEMDIASLYSMDYSGGPVQEGIAADNSLAVKGENKTVAGEDVHILYIKGEDLTESGQASRWTYAVRHMNRIFLITQDRYGQSVIEWNASMPKDELTMDRIISPSELFSRNRVLIFSHSANDKQNHLSLTLINGTYFVRITGKESAKVLTFNAETGALL
jgi:hypothetical protein